MKPFSRNLKRFSATLVAGVTFNIFLSWISHSSFSTTRFILDVVFFTVVGMTAGFLIDKRRLPDVLLRGIDSLQQISPSYMARSVIRVVVGYPVLVFGTTALLFWTNDAPAVEALPETAQTIYKTTMTIGMLWVLVGTILKGVSIALHSSSSASASIDIYTGSVIRFFEQIILLSLALVAIRFFGTDLTEAIKVAKEHPDDALAVMASIVVVRWMSSLVRSRTFSAARDVDSAVSSSKLLFRRERSQLDIHRTATHEAGHVLMFGCRGNLPADLSVTVYPELSPYDLYRGFVNHSESTPDVLTESYLRWLMRMYLAGSEAEYVAYGEKADGALNDNTNWLNVATKYLSTGFGEVFYATPEGESQREHNRAILNDLKAECVQQVRQFLEANRVLLVDLATAIVEQKTLNRDQLEPYLARITSTDVDSTYR